MEKEQVIKTEDLCARCRFSFEEWCRYRGDCRGCENYCALDCRCLRVKKNTPCPYFDERGSQ